MMFAAAEGLTLMTDQADAADSAAPEVSVVMPCLNEAETLEACIHKARKAFQDHHIDGEIVVADNGSTDGSQEIAARLGARVVPVAARGYGSALQAGIAAARGQYVIMGDADDSYDFTAIQPFVEQLRRGVELVMGNRFQGGIMPGAMPWTHRWLGNPVLSWMGRRFFGSPFGDFHCGLRGFRKDAYERLQMQTTGMEFASEMVIKSTLLMMKTAEVPTVLHKDGRSRPPHLRTWRDGWRHLRFMLLFSPRWLFLIPGTAFFGVGLLASLWLMGGPRRVGPVVFDIVTLLVAAFVLLLGYQLVIFAVFTKIFTITHGLHPPRTHLYKRVFRGLNLEIGVIVGLALALGGFLLLGHALWNWRAAGFGDLDPRAAMREGIPAVTLLMLGVQTVFASFFLSILTLARK
ncbi:MAG TPA: glycosyltransferase family 2 protein [Gemmataceae bacterium]|jgi:glycosyltransferase involved in cell wall biosynthesis|nr:glycosyltransferase family 2 protein [Gemmataceae bacterium]